MLHTKFESSGPCGFGEEDFFMFSNCNSIGAKDPWGWGHFLPQQHGWPCGFGEEDFFCFSHEAPGAGSVWTPGAWLAGFIKRTTIHCYIQNMKALGLVVSEKIFFYVFPTVSLWELSVAMETRVLIQPGPKPNTTFPSPQ